MNAQATIAALTTAPARGGIAVIVLSGPETQTILRKIFRPRRNWPEEGQLSLGWIIQPGAPEQLIDEAVVTLDRKPNQEPSLQAPAPACLAEINIHGGPQVARTVLTLLSQCGAEILAQCPCDPALAGAADNGNPAIIREMLSALRQATTPLAVAAVTAQASGGLTALAAEALDSLGGGPAHVTGGGSPQPPPVGDCPDAAGRETRRALVSALLLAADGWRCMKRLLEPAEVVIAGPPNAGKSALANALAGRNVSIVSDTPGTTRDWVRHLTDADGAPIWLTDTAGVWETSPGVSGRAQAVAPTAAKRDQTRAAVDAEAVRRAWLRIESADLVLCLTAGSSRQSEPLLARLRRLGNVVCLSGKCDKLPKDPLADLSVSAVTLEGIGQLRRLIRARLGLAGLDPSQAMAFTARQAQLLRRSADGLAAGDLEACRRGLLEMLGAASD